MRYVSVKPGEEDLRMRIKEIAAVRPSCGAPRILVDNGSEFTSRALDAWAYREDVRLDFSRPGKPTDDAHIESFSARLHAACLNAHVFESLEDAEEPSTSWRCGYSAVRPHSALGMLTPKEFAEIGQGSQGR